MAPSSRCGWVDCKLPRPSAPVVSPNTVEGCKSRSHSQPTRQREAPAPGPLYDLPVQGPACGAFSIVQKLPIVVAYEV